MPQIIGRVTKDAVQTVIHNGNKVVNFSFVESHSYKDKQGNKHEDTTFYDCALWTNAEIAPYLVKGAALIINGTIQAQAYTDRETGNPKATIKVKVDRFEFLPSTTSKQPTTTVEADDTEIADT